MLRRPKFTFNRVSQVFFTFREVVRIVVKIRPRLVIAMFVVSALWGVATAPSFYLQKLILDDLVKSIGNPNWRPLLYSIGLLVFLKILLDLGRSMLTSISNYLRRVLSRVFVARIEYLIGKKMTELDLSTIDDPNFQDKFNKISREAGNRSWGLVAPLSDIPNYFVGFLSSVFLLFLLHPLAAIGVLLFSLPRFFVNSRFIKRDYQLDSELSPKYRMWGWLNYYLIRNKSFMELKILNLGDYLSARLKLIQDEINEKVNNFAGKREFSSFWSGIPLSIFELLVSIWMVFLVITVKITIGSFTLYLSALSSAEQNLGGLVNSFLELYENYIYVADLVWFLKLEPQIKLEQGTKVLKKKEFGIEFKNVWFKYRDGQKWVTKGMNLKIKSNEKIAVVGLNGAGKSTLIKLLARFYDPEKGEILIDGINLKNYDITSWRNGLAVLFQEFESYPFSVNESIGYGDIKRIDDFGGIKSAVRKTGMEWFVKKLPKNYENPLDPEFQDGVRPSIGQMQRLGISRMIFRKNARVIIMDEPTSSVDPQAEEKIFKELVDLAKNKILIFVTQRFSTVRLADRVIVLDGGRIVENGTHKELMKENGEYARLFKLQAKGYQ